SKSQKHLSMEKRCPRLQLRSTRKTNCSPSHCHLSFRPAITRSRLVSLGKSISKDKDFFTRLIKNKAAAREKSYSVRNLSRLTPAGFSLAGTSRFFARVSN